MIYFHFTADFASFSDLSQKLDGVATEDERINDLIISSGPGLQGDIYNVGDAYEVIAQAIIALAKDLSSGANGATTNNDIAGISTGEAQLYEALSGVSVGDQGDSSGVTTDEALDHNVDTLIDLAQAMDGLTQVVDGMSGDSATSFASDAQKSGVINSMNNVIQSREDLVSTFENINQQANNTLITSIIGALNKSINADTASSSAINQKASA